MAAYAAEYIEEYGYMTAAPHEVEPERRSARKPQSGPVRVLRGKGLDARAHKGVSVGLLQAFRMALLVGACVFALGLVRVGVCANTVATLESNDVLKQEVSSAQDTHRSLQIEVNALSNNTRIANLATQKFNMVYAGAGETIHVNLPQQ